MLLKNNSLRSFLYTHTGICIDARYQGTCAKIQRTRFMTVTVAWCA